MSFAQQVKEARTAQKLSISEIRRRTGLSHGTIVNAESGLKIRKNTRASLIKVLGLAKPSNVQGKLDFNTPKLLVETRVPILDPFTGNELKRLRETLKLTQRELSEKTKFTQGTICHWESGRWFPSAHSVNRLRSYFEPFIIPNKQSAQPTRVKVVEAVQEISVPIVTGSMKRVILQKNDEVYTDQLDVTKYYGVEYLGRKALVTKTDAGFFAFIGKGLTSGNYLVNYGGATLQAFAESVCKVEFSEMVQFDTFEELLAWVVK